MDEMSRILDNLYIGRELDSQNDMQMSMNKITHVVRIDAEPEKVWKVPLDPPPEYFCVQATDRLRYNMRAHFSPVTDFMHKARLGGGIVLVHCAAGASRSVSLATAYLMSVTDYGFTDVLRVIKKSRSVAWPNDGFVRQFEAFEKEGLEKERRRIREKFALKTEDPVGDNTKLQERLYMKGE